MAKRKMTPTPAYNIAKQIMETYHPQDAQDIQASSNVSLRPSLKPRSKERCRTISAMPAMHAPIPATMPAMAILRRRSKPHGAKSPSMCCVAAKALSSRKLSRSLNATLLPRWQDFRPLEARYEPTRHCFHRGGYLWLQGVARTSLPYHGLHTGRSPRLAAPSVETLLSLRIRRLPVRLTAHGARRPAVCRARHPSI